ncbi:hypothetical protein C1336_000020054 [Campylobacter jejuni subsp. jejuni 1336]|nr:hypothetical protein C1336_000020054 [Campylobacter jejuni subsp. jejuni 1336]
MNAPKDLHFQNLEEHSLKKKIIKKIKTLIFCIKNLDYVFKFFKKIIT